MFYDIEVIVGFYIEFGKVYDENFDKIVVIDMIWWMVRVNEFNMLVEYFEGLCYVDVDVYKFNNLVIWVFGNDIKLFYVNEIFKLFFVVVVVWMFGFGCYYCFCLVLLGECEIGKLFMVNFVFFDFGNIIEL